MFHVQKTRLGGRTTIFGVSGIREHLNGPHVYVMVTTPCVGDDHGSLTNNLYDACLNFLLRRSYQLQEKRSFDHGRRFPLFERPPLT